MCVVNFFSKFCIFLTGNLNLNHLLIFFFLIDEDSINISWAYLWLWASSGGFFQRFYISCFQLMEMRDWGLEEEPGPPTCNKAALQDDSNGTIHSRPPRGRKWAEGRCAWGGQNPRKTNADLKNYSAGLTWESRSYCMSSSALYWTSCFHVRKSVHSWKALIMLL